MVRPPATFSIYDGSSTRRLEGLARVHRHYSPRWQSNCHLARSPRYAQSSYSLAFNILSQSGEPVSVYVCVAWTKWIWEDRVFVVGMFSPIDSGIRPSDLRITGRVSFTTQIQNPINYNPHLSNIHIHNRDLTPLGTRILQPLPLRKRPQSPRRKKKCRQIHPARHTGPR